MTTGCGTLGTIRCRHQVRTNHGKTGTPWDSLGLLKGTRGPIGEGLPSLRTTQCGDLEAPANGEVLTWGPEAVVEQSPTTGAPRPRVNPEARAIGEPEMGVQCNEDPPGMVTAPQCLAEHTTSPTTWELISGVLAKAETGVQLHQVAGRTCQFLAIWAQHEDKGWREAQ